MVNKFKKINTDENGLTLAELLASIVILSIILISVITIFVQTMKTNKTSEEIVDATYVAQMEMENIYAVSKGNNPSVPSEYDQKDDQGNWNIYHKYMDEFLIELQTQKAHETMMRIVVKVYDINDETAVKAQMENLYKWGANQ